MVLGGGPNRIGQGIEFDYCCVHAALALREDGYETIMVNCNPGDGFNRLRHLRPALFRAADAGRCARNRAQGKSARCHCSVRWADTAETGPCPGSGGCARSLAPRRIPSTWPKTGSGSSSCWNGSICGNPPTGPRRIRNRRCGWRRKSAIRSSSGRPTCSAGGPWTSCMARMNCGAICAMRSRYPTTRPVLLDRFLDHAKEVDVDAICDGEDVLIGGIMEHIEQAGVHSGDSACSLAALFAVPGYPG